MMNQWMERSYFGTFTHIELHTTSWRILKVTMISHVYLPVKQPETLSFFLSHATAYKEDYKSVHVIGLPLNTPRRPQRSAGRKSRR